MSSIETVDNISSADILRPVGTHIVSSFTTNGSGTGATFEVIIGGDSAVNVSVISKGSGYATNDTITITDAYLGNGGGASLTFDVNEVS
tara:strand:+ start:275 stop:541 length:267 start_codon:yes stop_codon:yes gene_type:complete